MAGTVFVVVRELVLSINSLGTFLESDCRVLCGLREVATVANHFSGELLEFMEFTTWRPCLSGALCLKFIFLERR